MNDAFLLSLGICMKAKKLSYGFDTVKESLQSGAACVVFVTNDISQKSQKEIIFECKNVGVEIIKTAYDTDTLGGAIGRKTKIVSVNDKGFADMLKLKLSYNKEDIL